MMNKDIAICVRKADFSETSQVVTLFTRNAGKLAAVAKGAKRKKSSFDGAIEIFSYGEILYSQSANANLATLTEFQQQPVFQFLSTRLITLNSGLFAAELLNTFTEEHDRHPELFDSFIQFLTDVQSADGAPACLSLLILFQLTLLNEVGTKPVFARCANCKIPFSNQWPHFYFSSLANGLACPDCEFSFADKLRISKETAMSLADLKRIANADERTLNEIEKVLITHFTELTHRIPKMAKYFLKH